MDRRTARTRKWFINAMQELLIEKPYHDITIQEITDRADTARVTFYRYYKSKDELLQAVIMKFQADLGEVMQSPFSNQDGAPVIGRKNLVSAFNAIKNRKEITKAIFLNQTPLPIRLIIREYIMQQFIIVMRADKVEETVGHRKEVIAMIVSESIISLLIWWLENDCETNPEELIDIMIEFFEQGILGITGRASLFDD